MNHPVSCLTWYSCEQFTLSWNHKGTMMIGIVMQQHETDDRPMSNPSCGWDSNLRTITTVTLYFPLYSSFFHSLLGHDRRNSISVWFTSFVLSFIRTFPLICALWNVIEAVLWFSSSHILVKTRKIYLYLLFCAAKVGLHTAKIRHGHTVVLGKPKRKNPFEGPWCRWQR